MKAFVSPAMLGLGLFMSWLMTACGSSPAPVDVISAPLPAPSASATPNVPVKPPVAYKGDRAFAPYLERFLADGLEQGKTYETRNLTIQFSDIPGWGAQVVGLCQTGLANGPILSVKPSFWNRVSETQKMLLMHHELGHCVLYRDHLTTARTDGNPVSIMYPVIISDAQYAKSKASYLRELFTLQPAVDQMVETFACTPEDL